MPEESENQKRYRKREKRVNDAIGLIQPDRVPIVTLADAFLVKSAGVTLAQATYDAEKMAAAFKQTVEKYNWDMVKRVPATIPGAVWEMLGMKTYKWPGYNLGDNSFHQWIEKEYMLEDEYDELLENPSDYTIRKLLPRFGSVFKPLQTLPPLTLIGSVFGTDGMSIAAFAGQPPFIEMMDRLKQAGEEFNQWNAAAEQLRGDLKEMGCPVLLGSFSMCPFDVISDFMRGLEGSLIDMHRQPDKLKAAVKLFEPLCLEMTIGAAARSGNNRVFIPLHRGAAGFMSDKQYAEFYWPGLKRLLMGLIDADLVPLPFFEGDYTPRLKYLAELPPGKILGHFDRIDRKRCKEVLGDTMCFWGNVPAQLLCTGTPDQVKDDVKELIDTFADNGGLIVDASCSIPPESKPENVEAMTEVVFDYGKR